MATKPVVILGAGATKACDGPLTNEILPQVFQMKNEALNKGDWTTFNKINREGFLDTLDEFLVGNFHVPSLPASRQLDDYPALPLLLSLIDTAIDRQQSFGPNWNTQRLRDVRDSLEYAIFAILDYQLQRTTNDLHRRLVDMLYRDTKVIPTVISLNYDIIADNTLVRVIQDHLEELAASASAWQAAPPATTSGFPSYGCDIATPAYLNWAKFGKILKLHGSLNWLYCPGCHRLDIGISESGTWTIKVLQQLYIESPLERHYACHGSRCPDCGVFVRPVLITPSHHKKDYRNPHVAQVWYQAERALREADRAIIIGYSLPEDDVEVVYLLKRGLTNVPAKEITVVEYDQPMRRPVREHPVGNRYRSLFGDDLDWRTEGFADWLTGYEQHNLSPLSARLPD